MAGVSQGDSLTFDPAHLALRYAIQRRFARLSASVLMDRTNDLAEAVEAADPGSSVRVEYEDQPDNLRIEVIRGGKKVGYFRISTVPTSGYTWENLVPQECKDAWEQMGRPRLWAVRGAEWFDARLIGQGLGSMAYQILLDYVPAGDAVGPDLCAGGNTSADAEGVWRRLRLRNTSVGPLIKVADLSPPLGLPGGPCKVMERIENNVRGPREREKLIRKVEEAEDLDNKESAAIYPAELENTLPGSSYKKILLTGHAQYRMDLRGVTVNDVRLVFREWHQKWSKGKSTGDGFYRRMEDLIESRPTRKIEFEGSQGLGIVFAVGKWQGKDRGAIEVVTVYFAGEPKPKPTPRTDCDPWEGWSGDYPKGMFERHFRVARLKPLWHITKDRNFRPDPDYRPPTSGGMDVARKPTIYATTSPFYWHRVSGGGEGPWTSGRAWAAELEVLPGHPPIRRENPLRPQTVLDPSFVRVKRVIPVEHAIAEETGYLGDEWVGSDYRYKSADLNPSLGFPGGACQVIERIDQEVPNLRLRDKLVDLVEDGTDLSNAQSAQVYKTEDERGPSGTRFKRMLLTPHVQYRMDLRGVNVSDLRLFFKRFQKAWSDARSRQEPIARRWESDMAWGSKIEWVDSQGLFVAFSVKDRTVTVITTYWKGVPDPRPVNESACALPSRVAARHAAMQREAALRDLWMKWIVQPAEVIWKHHKEFVQGPVDDAMDIIIKELAPELVRAIVEQEVDADLDEFIEGAQKGKWDTERGFLADPKGPTVDWEEGYSWGYANPAKVKSNLPPDLKRKLVEEAVREYRHKITEEVIERALWAAWDALSPVTTFRSIWAAVKRHGWKLGLVIALVEIIETFVIPGALIAATGDPEWATVGMLPLSEILYAVVFRILGRVPSEVDEVDEDGHLDWYEAQYGPVRLASDLGDCFEANGRYFMDAAAFPGGNNTLHLVHGEVTGQGPLEGVKYGHAWIEDGNMVIDVSNGRTVRMPKATYYALGRIGDNVHHYDAPAFRRKVMQHKHWGPWDLVTSTGL
jgi:hypothetical protein